MPLFIIHVIVTVVITLRAFGRQYRGLLYTCYSCNHSECFLITLDALGLAKQRFIICVLYIQCSYNDTLLIAVYITRAIFVSALSALVFFCILIIISYNYCLCAKQYDDLFTCGRLCYPMACTNSYNGNCTESNDDITRG